MHETSAGCGYCTYSDAWSDLSTWVLVNFEKMQALNARFTCARVEQSSSANRLKRSMC